jgi:hypothetical protein
MANDSIEKVPYRIGYSFKNPSIFKPLTRTRNPFWQIHYEGKGPAQIRKEMWKRGILRKYPSMWRREAKANTVKGLGDIEKQEQELPDFYELGQAPGPTKEQSSDAVVRSPFGQLLNVALTGFKTVVEEEGKLQQIKAGYMPQSTFPFIPQEYQSNVIPLLGIGLAIGLGSYLLMKK